MQNKPHFYGRRRTRSLRQNMKFDFNEVLSSIKLSEYSHVNLFKKPVWMEVGFGGGEHMLAKALENPHVNFIGCEPFLNGVASFIREIKKHNLENIWLYPDDVRLIFSTLPHHCLDRFFLLFPDPWPKKKHHKRRFFNIDNIKEVYRLLKPVGSWYLATDHEDYACWIEEILNRDDIQKMLKIKHFWNFDQRPNIDEWPITRYEQKALKDNRDSKFWILEAI